MRNLLKNKKDSGKSSSFRVTPKLNIDDEKVTSKKPVKSLINQTTSLIYGMHQLDTEKDQIKNWKTDRLPTSMQRVDTTASTSSTNKVLNKKVQKYDLYKRRNAISHTQAPVLDDILDFEIPIETLRHAKQQHILKVCTI